MAGLITAIWRMLCDVFLFWITVCLLFRNDGLCVLTFLQSFFRWLTRKKPVEIWFEILKNAKTYEEWEEAAFQLDGLLGNDLW